MTGWQFGAALLAMLNSAACATLPNQQSWCSTAATPTHVERNRTARFHKLSQPRLAEAMRRLGNASRVELTRESAQHFLGRNAPDDGKSYYLVRAVAYAPQTPNLSSFYSDVDLDNIQLWLINPRDAVILSVQPLTTHPVDAQNIPLVLEIPFQIDSIAVTCYYVH